MADILKLLDDAKKRAFNGGLPIRRKDGSLYAVLAGCLFICEKVQREQLEDELRNVVKVSVDVRGENNAGKGRRYVFKESDAFTLVARYVLNNDGRNSVYRYAMTLREANKRGITSGELQKWLLEEGGVQALFLTRDVPGRTHRTKTLQLSESIEYEQGVSFTLVLEFNGKGVFEVKKGVAK